MMRVIKAFLPAVIVAYLLASILFTQTILATVQSFGLEVSFAQRLGATWHDILGMASSYLLLLLVAFVIALPVAAGLTRILPSRRALLFTLAGFLAVVALHVIMKAVLGISGIAATRTLAGLIGQGLAGALGGYVYHRLSRTAVSEPLRAAGMT
tara:strand:- start:8191 stop:8652 length:462 start_codon:yes stop_codon:yes gene_type:complete